MSRSRRVFEEGFILALAAAARGFAVVPDDGSATPTASPRVVSGRGVPTLVLPVSSVYIRIDAPDDDTWLYRANERKAQGDHTLQGTFATPVYLSEAMSVELLLTCNGTASGVLDIVGLELLGAETIVDAA